VSLLDLYGLGYFDECPSGGANVLKHELAVLISYLGMEPGNRFIENNNLIRRMPSNLNSLLIDIVNLLLGTFNRLDNQNRLLVILPHVLSGTLGQHHIALVVAIINRTPVVRQGMDLNLNLVLGLLGYLLYLWQLLL
jgi:hypothetical protein